MFGRLVDFCSSIERSFWLMSFLTFTILLGELGACIMPPITLRNAPAAGQKGMIVSLSALLNAYHAHKIHSELFNCWMCLEYALAEAPISNIHAHHSAGVQYLTLSQIQKLS